MNCIIHKIILPAVFLAGTCLLQSCEEEVNINLNQQLTPVAVVA